MNKAKHSISYKWKAMSVVALGSLMATLDTGSIRIALPHLGHVFQVDPNTVIWVWLIYLIIGTGLMLTLGRAGDTFGRKRLYTSGFIIFNLGLGLCSIAQSFIQLVMFRLIQAVGGAMSVAMGYAIITTSFPSEERGRALGIMMAVAGVGLFSGPALGGFLLDTFGWQSIFYFRLPLGIIGVTMAWTLLKEQFPPKREGRFDLLGAASLFFTLACLLLAVNLGQSLGWTSPLVLVLGVTGVLLLLLFLFVERISAQPVLDLRLFSNRLFSVASTNHVLIYIATIMVNFLMPFYLIEGLGFSASTAGLLLITIYAVSVVVSPISGRLSDKCGTLLFCASGLMLVSVGMLLLSRLDTDASISEVVLYLVVLGVAMGLFTSPNTSAIMGSVPPERLGTASAMVGTLRQLGMAIGLAIAGTVFATRQLFHVAQLTSQGLPEDVVYKLSTIGGVHDTILAGLAIAVIGLIISALRGKR